MEEIVILSYNENHELVLRDVLGMGETIKSALILDVNTMNQKCVILENPIIKNFINLFTKLNTNQVEKSDFNKIISKLEELKRELKS